MKRIYALFFGLFMFLLTLPFRVYAFKYVDHDPADSLIIHELEEVEVIGSSFIMRQTGTLNKMPGTYSLITPLQIEQFNIHSITDLSSVVPNFYMPDYGSRLTSAIYVRGIGARSSDQTIGLYVDGVPVMNKAGFNMEMQGLQAIEVLNGPQGTLYGRNAMGGIINLYTYSPIDKPGTDLQFRAGNYNSYRIRANHRMKFSDNWGLTIGGYFSRRDGFFKNEYTRKYADDNLDAGVNLKLEWRSREGDKLAFSSQFDFTDQGAFPYRRLRKDGLLEKINYNDPGSYLRRMNGNRLRYTKEWNEFVLETATGYSYLSDKMNMDQDYTPLDGFTITQKQKMNGLSQELLIKSKERDFYEWSWGVFGFYDRNEMDASVRFKPEGIKMILQRSFDKLNSSGKLPFILTADTSKDALNNNFFIKSNKGVALYHQSTLKDLLISGFSVTGGIRLDYEKQTLTYHSDVAFRVGLTPRNKPAAQTKWIETPAILEGEGKKDFVQILPKIAFKYTRGNMLLFASMAKGYKAGGYNEQMMSDAVQLEFQRQLMFAKKGTDRKEDHAGNVAYAPEHAVNYELGMRGKWFDNRLHVSLAGFYTDIADIQLTQFVASGAGRVISNAGKANTRGMELTVRAGLFRSLMATVNYGYMHTTFVRYFKEQKTDRGIVQHDLSGNFIPYIPRNTYNVILSMNEALAKSFFIERVFASLDLQGAGPIYWDDFNTVKQNAYHSLNARMGFSHGMVSVSFWGRNLTKSDHTVFYFESFGNKFLQQAAPMQIGVDLNVQL